MTRGRPRKRSVEISSAVDVLAAGNLEAETIEVSQAEEPVEAELKSSKPEKTELYFVCPFCAFEDTELSGNDPINTWCRQCGKCFLVEWRERRV